MKRIRLASGPNLTHFETSGFYATRETTPDAQAQKEIFIRGRIGFMDGTNFVAVSRHEESVTDRLEMASIWNTPTLPGETLGDAITRTINEFMTSTGRLPGTIE